jgi:hypothetical protein
MTDRSLKLPIVDGLQLPAEVREALLPGEEIRDETGAPRRLPRWFFAIDRSDDAVRHLELAPSFELREFMRTDVREARVLQGHQRYLPLAIPLLATALSVLRQRWGTYVFIAANGGYRSPGHALTREASTHCWGTAANIYRIGDTYLDTQETIERYAAEVRETLPGAYVRPWGHGPGEADDHLHVDLGYVTIEPHGSDAVEDVA